MSLYPKKSQVTIFLIAAVFIFAIIAATLMSNKANISKTYDAEIRNSHSISYDAEAISNFVDGCLFSVSRDALMLIGGQNGRLFVSQGGIIQDYNVSLEGITFASNNGIKVAFGEEEVFSLRKKDGLNSVQEQLESFIGTNIGNCMDFSEFEKQNIAVKESSRIVNVSINENDVHFELHNTIAAEELGKTGSIQIDRFSSRHSIRLAKLYDFATGLFGKSIEELESITKNEINFQIKIEKAPSQDYIISITDAESKLNGMEYSYYFAKKNSNEDNLITGAAVVNNIPTANAGPGRTVELGKISRLFGSGSDLDKDPLTFKWQLIDKPGSSLAALSEDSIPNPTFTPDLEGFYLFRLRTNDGGSFSEPSAVKITAKSVSENTKSVSFAGQDRAANLNEKITLAGYGFDENSNPLLYMWHILTFPGTKIPTLQDQYTQSPTFRPEVEGEYTFALVTNDGKQDSEEAKVLIKVSKSPSNRIPTADPGYNKFVAVGKKVILLGTGYDPDKNHLNFLWSFQSKPNGSLASLSSLDVPDPSFTPDIEGNYSFVLVVDDAQLESAPSIVTYYSKNMAENAKPMAIPGEPFSVSVNEEFHLQGAGIDADNDALSYRWAIMQAPANSSFSLSNPNSPNPFFIADREGSYVLGLLVNDGKEDSDLKTITVTAVAGPSCEHGTCNLEEKQWCENGKFTSEGYCAQCGNNDSSCAICAGNSCDTKSQSWCESGKWNSGSYAQYCSRCSHADNSCPLCESNACDISSKVWCWNKTWVAIGYCRNCGKYDAACNLACADKACDTQNKAVCVNNEWKKSDYCLLCGNVDSSCYFECLQNACDIDAKKWCKNGAWAPEDYCVQCGSKDFSCSASCQGNLCDTSSNRWCSSGSWDSINYCSKCQDAECLNACSEGACDIDAKKWCKNGAWASEDYCVQCGSKDSSCSAACKENACDISSNKRCYNGTWTLTNYCSNCALKDKDCTIGCVDAQCDAKGKLVCAGGKWSDVGYCESCSDLDNSCKLENCTPNADGCCLEKQDNICDLDCSSSKDIDCSNLSCNLSGNCSIGYACSSNAECSSGFCKNAKCTSPSCYDNIKNGNETDIDCGSKCSKCSARQSCSMNSDCETGFCSSGLCESQDECADKIKNNDETDVDCGVQCKNKCASGSGCISHDDCDKGLICASDIASSKKICITDENKDTDDDGMPDQWEIKYGLNANLSSDAFLDSDEDGLQNLMEYSLGTNPKNKDSDNDKISDKEEINSNTDPLDEVSKPGGISSLLFAVIVLIILFGVGSYMLYYYKEKLLAMFGYGKYESPMEEMPLGLNIPVIQKTIPQKQSSNEKIGNVIEKRRAEKEKRRKEIFRAFDEGQNAQESKDIMDSFKSGRSSKAKDIFSKLKSIYEKKNK